MYSLQSLNEERFMEQLIAAMPDDKRGTLALNYASIKTGKLFYEQQEREQMKREIIDEVLARLSVMVENGEAIQKITTLEKAIERLGQ